MSVKYFRLLPQVPGSLVDSDSHMLHYQFDDFPFDCIVESMLHFLVTDKLKERLSSIRAGLLDFRQVAISKSPDYDEHTAHLTDNALPEFFHMLVEGTPGENHLGISNDPEAAGLVVSGPVLEIMAGAGLNWCDVIDWQTGAILKSWTDAFGESIDLTEELLLALDTEP